LRFAVIGDLGMFGSELKSHLLSKSFETSGFNRVNIDLESSVEELAMHLDSFDVIINAVAYTDVDKAEQETELANRINGEYAGKLARASAINKSKFLQISTDYVFDGTARSPISPTEKTNPLNAYGRSKALGEDLVQESGADFVILRTAWLYGQNGNCFPKTIAKRLLGGESISVVSDQFGQPTWTRDLAEIALSHSLNNFGDKVVHAVSSGETSWYEFAVAIGRSLGIDSEFEINPAASADFKTSAKRPYYSVLDNQQTRGPVIGNWLERWKLAAPEIFRSA
jgi:dTDP-4-dehydrorhamnose reductase